MLDKIKLKKIGIFSGIFIFVSLIIMTYYTKIFSSDIVIDSVNIPRYIKFFAILTSIAIVVSIACLFAFKNYNDKNIHKKYFICAILIGMCYIIMIPLFSQSDEAAHYVRTYNIVNNGEIVNSPSEKKQIEQVVIDSIFVNGDQFKKKNYDNIIKMSQFKNDGNKVNYTGLSEAAYSPTTYLPLIIGVKVGQLLNFNPYFTGMLARIFSLFFCVSLVTLGIKLLPKGKFFISMIFLSPVALQYMSAFSSDGTLFTYFFLLLAYTLNIREKEKKLGFKGITILFILSLLIGLTKTVYSPLVFIILLIPNKSFSNKKNVAIILKSVIIFSTFVIDYLWLKLPALLASQTASSLANHTNGWIFHNPVKFIMIIISNFINDGYGELTNIFGSGNLCHYNFKCGNLIPFLLLVTYTCAYLSEKIDYKIKKSSRIFYALIAVGIYVSIATVMYYYNTPENYSTIFGLQGRYLFPVLLLIILYPNKKFNINKKYVILGNIFTSFLVMLTLIKTFMV